MIAVGYIPYGIVTENGVAYLQSAKHLKSDGYFGVTKSMQILEVLIPHSFKGHIDFTYIYLKSHVDSPLKV